MNGWGLMVFGFFVMLISFAGDEWDKEADVVFYLSLVMMAAGFIWGVTVLVIDGIP